MESPRSTRKLSPGDDNTSSLQSAKRAKKIEPLNWDKYLETSFWVEDKERGLIVPINKLHSGGYDLIIDCPPDFIHPPNHTVVYKTRHALNNKNIPPDTTMILQTKSRAAMPISGLVDYNPDGDVIVPGGLSVKGGIIDEKWGINGEVVECILRNDSQFHLKLSGKAVVQMLFISHLRDNQPQLQEPKSTPEQKRAETLTWIYPTGYLAN